MDLNVVMDEVAARLDTISPLHVYGYLPDLIVPPAAIVAYPEITFDETKGRDSDWYELPVMVLDGKVSDRASRRRLAAYAKGSGPSSIKQVIETGTYVSFDSVRVSRLEFAPFPVAGVDYMAAIFTLSIIGGGSYW